MNFCINHILIKLSLLTGVILSMCACSSEDSPLQPVVHSMELAVRVRLNSADSQGIAESNIMTTRAGDYFFEDPSNDYERLITSLRVIIIRTDKNNLIETNEFYDFESFNNSIDKLGYLHFSIIPDENKRIYFIANELTFPREIRETLASSLIGEYLRDDFFDMKWTLDKPVPLLDNNNNPAYIPMTEFFDFYADSKNVDSIDEDGVGTIIKDYFITRAATKFRFSIEDGYSGKPAGPGFRIKALHFSKLSNEEYVFPHDTEYSPSKYDVSQEYHGGRAVTYFTTPSTAKTFDYTFYPDRLGMSGTIFQNMNSGWSPLLYFAETRLATENGFSIGAEIEFDNPDPDGDCLIKYANVNLDNLPQLPRNTIVDIVIKVLPTDVRFSVALVPYYVTTLKPEFGFDDIIYHPNDYNGLTEEEKKELGIE